MPKLPNTFTSLKKEVFKSNSSIKMQFTNNPMSKANQSDSNP